MADRDTTDTGRTGTHSASAGMGTGDTVAGLKQSIGRAASEAADTAMDTGREAVGSAQGRIRSLLEQQTDRAADQLGGVASALHKAADHLNAENNGTAAQYAVQAADRVERVADMLRHSSLDDIVGEVEGFARRQPEIFIGGAFALGFLAARFIKSSGERRLHGQTGTVHSRAAEAAGRNARRSADYRTAEGSGRAMAGGIADSALRTPRRAADLGEGTGSPLNAPGGAHGIGAPGIGAQTSGMPKPAAGLPLSRAPASASGHNPPPTGSGSAETALGSATIKTPDITTASVKGADVKAVDIKPAGQRP
ncbi:hypothetical protein [Azospirillum agricola]|uniref:hypothetical protein n=1 Tax=Azospirillum agricola TaxID=1720247 RepID=UPI000A0EF17E|nr:hypothetical protein [Azospirillum agricola]SMH43879.1 hypothetical protein SAMN02982994_1996 [Azospirillum lipoferum]